MRIPDAFFPLINFMMKLLLRSPLHFIFSSNVLLISFKGRRSGKQYTTPVRYIRDDTVVRMFSSPGAKWWLNLRGGASVTLCVKGHSYTTQARVNEEPMAAKLEKFVAYLKQFPGDGAYHGLRIRRGKPLPHTEIKAVLPEVVIVEASSPPD